MAKETNQPLHHRSGKVSVKYLINITDIEQKLLTSLETQLEELVEEKLPAIVSNTVERILKEQFKHLLEGSEIEAETEKPTEEVTPTLLDEIPENVRAGH